MTQNETYLDHPIDIMLLIHKAFKAHSLRTENLARERVNGRDLQHFKDSF